MIGASWAAAGTAALVWATVMSTRWLRAHHLMRSAQPFSQQPLRPNDCVVIAGDSTAVGAGSSHPRLSVAGRIGMALSRAEVLNVARSGARLAQVTQQFDRIDSARRVSLVIVLCGGNDIVRGGTRRGISRAIDALAARVRSFGARLVLVPPGVVGRAPIWLPPLSWFYTWRARWIRRAMFDAARRRTDVDVVDLVPARREGRNHHASPGHYATDGLHPNDIGYGVWFEKIVQQSARLRARLTGSPISKSLRNARSVRWSPHILRAAAI